jgi:hypothetical protein
MVFVTLAVPCTNTRAQPEPTIASKISAYYTVGLGDHSSTFHASNLQTQPSLEIFKLSKA